MLLGKIIKILFLSTLLAGIVIIVLFYNLSSKLKFLYTDIKNNYTNDNKFLAVVNDTGLWLKDETSQSILIIKSNNIHKTQVKKKNMADQTKLKKYMIKMKIKILKLFYLILIIMEILTKPKLMKMRMVKQIL